MVLAASRTYGRAHKNERARLRPLVDAGHAECTEPICLLDDRWIEPGTPWDLAHDRDAGPGHYHGPAHSTCNRSEGARWQHIARHLGLDDPPPPPRDTRWWRP